MTDELLSRAARALRDAHTGERQGSGFTRARIMNTVHRERRRRVLRWAVFSPIASLLLVGSAWAQSTGKWPVIWKAVTSVLVAAPSNEAGQSPGKGKAFPGGSPRPGARPALDDEAGKSLDAAPLGDPTGAVEQPPPPEPTAAEPEPPAAREPLPSPRAPTRPRSKRSVAPASRPSEPTPSPAPVENDAEVAPQPGRDRELSRFRAAHDLHFMGDRPREAIQAYAEYLREYPNGRFVPEARYNGALDQIKLGNEAAARKALAPFAAGRFDGYRQKEARELLEALDRQASGSKR